MFIIRGFSVSYHQKTLLSKCKRRFAVGKMDCYRCMHQQYQLTCVFKLTHTWDRYCLWEANSIKLIAAYLCAYQTEALFFYVVHDEIAIKKQIFSNFISNSLKSLPVIIASVLITNESLSRRSWCMHVARRLHPLREVSGKMAISGALILSTFIFLQFDSYLIIRCQKESCVMI